MEQKSTSKVTRQSWSNEVINRYHGQQEDQLLLDLVQKHGLNSWNLISSEFTSSCFESNKPRSGAACRERYQNILDPSLNKQLWTEAEEAQLFKLQSQLGNCWAKISQLMPGRSELLCKNQFYATIRKVLRRLCRAVGHEKASEMLKSIKPSTLGLIYSNDQKDKRMNLDLRKQYQSLICKYRHLDKKHTTKLDSDELAIVNTLIDQIMLINDQYNENKKKIIKQKKHINVFNKMSAESISNELPEQNDKYTQPSECIRKFQINEQQYITNNQNLKNNLQTSESSITKFNKIEVTQQQLNQITLKQEEQQYSNIFNGPYPQIYYPQQQYDLFNLMNFTNFNIYGYNYFPTTHVLPYIGYQLQLQ